LKTCSLNAKKAMLLVNPKNDEGEKATRKMKLNQLMLQLLAFDATFEKTEATAVVVIVTISLLNQRTLLVSHVAERAAAMIPRGNQKTLLVNHVSEKAAMNLVTTIKLTSLVKLNQLMLQQLLALDAIFEKTADVIAAVVITRTSLGNRKMPLESQRTQLVNHVSEKVVTMIPQRNLVMTTKLT